jgi:hypothetical protein
VADARGGEGEGSVGVRAPYVDMVVFLLRSCRWRDPDRALHLPWRRHPNPRSGILAEGQANL